MKNIPVYVAMQAIEDRGNEMIVLGVRRTTRGAKRLCQKAWEDFLRARFRGDVGPLAWDHEKEACGRFQEAFATGYDVVYYVVTSNITPGFLQLGRYNLRRLA